MPDRLNLYPPIEPFKIGALGVSPIHEIYYEVSGAPDGIPVIVCHGGPGGGSTPSMRRYFDPERYMVILFDQRGCGKSTPNAELEDNTTWALIGDMEKLREHLGVDRWMVFGGSWGSTLAMAYAQRHSDRVTGLILRGIFTLRREELLWFYQEGANWVFPDLWQDYLEPIPLKERSDMMAAYYKRLTSADRAEQMRAAKAWSRWEGGAVSLIPSEERMQSFASDAFALAFARIECHYFINNGFFDRDDYILNNIQKIKHIPAVIIQGRYDIVTPMKTAWELHHRWPGSRLEIVRDAGHAASEPGIIDALVCATNEFAGS